MMENNHAGRYDGLNQEATRERLVELSSMFLIRPDKA